MTDQQFVKDGVASKHTYVITYDEELWLGLSPERQQFCKDAWISRASPLPGVERVVLQLKPDILFPLRGHEHPFIEWQHELVHARDKQYVVITYNFIEIATSHTSRMTEIGLKELANKTIVETRKNGAHRYKITTGTKVIAEGKY